ncbi:Carbon monoxide dehydrogenase subunit G (CoxG) [Actinomadura rubteroloni]|uniref:Carbon monoxide dehydrogenase subunit G (CoxG) n=1 Tax=Actinomadura rubteroloni TaxID=1926885 RepID=A0A2P4UJN7_9ACTN|nr:SRPBCC family protein [Actinomadura rubteroloni]POM25262.1 Carbon monoxide dehydrogenase subunit G (CoxG) [Actinomadura rubteroloni]
MKLDHEFTVPVPVDRAWSVLRDVKGVVPFVPGATLDAVDGDTLTGRLRVKAGSITVTYRGTARVTSADAVERTITVEADGREARGPGTVTATLTARLHDADGGTLVALHTTLNVTGRITELGFDTLTGVGERLVARFARALADDLAARPGPEAVRVPVEEITPKTISETLPEPGVLARPLVPRQRTAGPDDAPPLSLRALPEPVAAPVAAPSIARRAAPAAVAALLAALVTIRLVRRRRA